MDEELFADCNLLKLGKTLVVGEVLVQSSEKEASLARSSITYYGLKAQT